ncbi:MAG: hypothetical protein H6584_04260 [Flavobacteriales bacterium]|nr:hypothetical protein [Flavobacteriales bacterium]
MDINKELKRLQELIEEPNSLNSNYSQKPTYWHIDHSLKVIMGISTMLKKSHPEQYKSKFNLKRFVIFFKGRIPRGEGHAPKGVMAEKDVSKEDLVYQLKRAKVLLYEVNELPPNSFFRHSVFGNLNVKRSLYFMAMHTRHHILIVEDILNS